MSLRAFVPALVATILASANASADQVILRLQNWSVTAPDKLDCSKPPTLVVSGSGGLFDASNRAFLQAVTVGIGPALSRQCPNVREVVLDDGRTKRLVKIASAGETPGMPSAAAVVPPAAPATPPAPPAPATAPATPLAAPAPTPTPQNVIQSPAARPPAPLAPPSTAERYQDRRLPSIESAKSIEAKCELLLTWMGRVAQESQPNARSAYTNLQKAVYLYRDEDFVPLFGKPFDQTTPKWRLEFHADVIRRCEGISGPPRPFVGPQRGLTAYMQQFSVFSAVIDGPFLGAGSVYSADNVTRAIAQARMARSWMDSETAAALRAPATVESLRNLRVRADEAAVQLTALWPSEQRYFAKSLGDRRAQLALVLAQAWLAEVGRLPATLEALQAIVAQREQNQEFLGAGVLGAAHDGMVAQLNATLDRLLEPVVLARTAQLSKASGLTGARQSVEWKTAFDRDFAGVAERPPVAGAQREYVAARQRLLQTALPEWKTAISEPGSAKDTLASYSLRLSELFPSSAPKDSIYGDYQQALKVEVEKKEQQEFVVAIAVCDTVGAHPDDPEAPGNGIADDQLNVTAVIAACEPATKAVSAPPRVAFQLARAYLKAERFEDATEQLIAAAKEGHGAALAYLGDLYLDGAPGIESDADLAYSLYERAVEAGFEPAKAVLAEFEDMTEAVAEADAEEAALMAELKKTNPELFTAVDGAGTIVERKPVDPDKIDFSKFFAAKWAAATYTNQLASLFSKNNQSSYIAFYDARDQVLEYFDTGLAFLRKEAFDPACPALVDPEFSAALQKAISLAGEERKRRLAQPPNVSNNNPIAGLVALLGAALPGLREADYADGIRQAREAGDFDMGSLVYEYGGCSDVPVQRFYNNAKAFVLQVVSEMQQ